MHFHYALTLDIVLLKKKNYHFGDKRKWTDQWTDQWTDRLMDRLATCYEK